MSPESLSDQLKRMIDSRFDEQDIKLFQKDKKFDKPDRQMGILSDDKKKVYFPDGSSADAVITGDPDKLDAVKVVNSKDALVLGEPQKCIFMSKTESLGFLIQFDENRRTFYVKDVVNDQLYNLDVWAICGFEESDNQAEIVAVRFYPDSKDIMVGAKRPDDESTDLLVRWGVLKTWELNDETLTVSGDGTIQDSRTITKETVESNLATEDLDELTPDIPEFTGTYHIEYTGQIEGTEDHTFVEDDTIINFMGGTMSSKLRELDVINFEPSYDGAGQPTVDFFGKFKYTKDARKAFRFVSLAMDITFWNSDHTVITGTSIKTVEVTTFGSWTTDEDPPEFNDVEDAPRFGVNRGTRAYAYTSTVNGDVLVFDFGEGGEGIGFYFLYDGVAPSSSQFIKDSPVSSLSHTRIHYEDSVMNSRILLNRNELSGPFVFARGGSSVTFLPTMKRERTTELNSGTVIKHYLNIDLTPHHDAELDFTNYVISGPDQNGVFTPPEDEQKHYPVREVPANPMQQGYHSKAGNKTANVLIDDLSNVFECKPYLTVVGGLATFPAALTDELAISVSAFDSPHGVKALDKPRNFMTIKFPDGIGTANVTLQKWSMDSELIPGEHAGDKVEGVCNTEKGISDWTIR